MNPQPLVAARLSRPQRTVLDVAFEVGGKHHGGIAADVNARLRCASDDRTYGSFLLRPTPALRPSYRFPLLHQSVAKYTVRRVLPSVVEQVVAKHEILGPSGDDPFFVR